MTKRVKLFVAIPSVGTIADATTHVLRRLEKRYEDRIEFIWPEQCVRRMFHDFARNALVKEFLASDAELLWFLDSDVTPPDDALDIITKHYDYWDVAGLPYPVFMTPAGEEYPQVTYTVYRGRNDKGLGLANVPSSGTDLVDGLATGCLFIRRHIFEKLPEPWFEFEYKSDTRELSVGEDLKFCYKINELGYKFFVDYSKVCNHYKTVGLLDVSNYAMEHTRKSLKNYDERIRAQLAPLVERKKSKLILPNT